MAGCLRPSANKKNSLWALFLSAFRFIKVSPQGRKTSNQSSQHLNRQPSRSRSSSLQSEDKPLGYLVNPVWPLESTSDSKLDLIFFEGNVGRRKYLSCKDTWVQRGKPDVWWPRDWLPEDFKGDIRVLLLEYSISEAGIEGVVDELQRLLVFSDRWNRGHTWQRPIVLVGHSIGCVVIEQLIVTLDKRAKAIGSSKDETDIGRAKVLRAFLASLAGCFFYAPPFKGLVRSEELLKHVFGGLSYSRDLFADLFVDSPKVIKLSEEFMQVRSEHVKLMALIEGFHTRGRIVVPPASMQDFAGTVVELEDSNHSDACKPTNKEHPAYGKLVEFIWDILYVKKPDIDYRMVSISIGPMKMDVWQEEAHPTDPITNLDIASQIRPLMHNSDVPSASDPEVFDPQDHPRHFYGNQCRVLKEHLSVAEEILLKEKVPNEVSSATLVWPQLALTELRRVFKLGKSIIESCYNDELCHKAYLRQCERTQAFAEALKEIVWCISVVEFYYSSGKRYLPWNPSIVMDKFPQARVGDEEQYQRELQKAASDDQRKLQSWLAIWIKNHSCSDKECGKPLSQHQADDPLMCLAAQILARVSNGEGDRVGNVEADHTTVLWKTSQEVLEDGRQIGKGSSATVFETTWLGDKYAKKEFYMVPKAFVWEANALAKLNHPHIVNVAAYSVGPNSCFLLMELMPSDLRTYMIERMNRLHIDRPFSMSAAIDLMLQISEAMSYMNAEGMVHRDLKALNILVKPVDDPELCKEGFVIAKLTDFGLAKSKHEVTSYSHMTRNEGTRLWMAPEMFKANEDDEQRLLVSFPRKADVYSFGIVCSEVLTGKMPFHNVSFRMGELYKLLTDSRNPLRPKLPESCPESLASLICECWHTDPVRRPTFEKISRRLRYFKGVYMMAAPHC